MGKSTISIAIFNCELLVDQRVQAANVGGKHTATPCNFQTALAAQPVQVRATPLPQWSGSLVGAALAFVTEVMSDVSAIREAKVAGDGVVPHSLGMSENGVYPQWNSHLKTG